MKPTLYHDITDVLAILDKAGIDYKHVSRKEIEADIDNVGHYSFK